MINAIKINKKNTTFFFYQDTCVYIYNIEKYIYEIYKFAPLLPWLETLFTKIMHHKDTS